MPTTISNRASGAVWRITLLLSLLTPLLACSSGSGDGEDEETDAVDSVVDAPARVGYFMSIDDNLIAGESTSESHRDWIELLSLADGLRLDAGSPGPDFVFDGLKVTKAFDRATPKLRRAIADGTIFGEIRIDQVARCGGRRYTRLAITLTTARIEALGAEVHAVDRQEEELDFNYTRIESMFTPVDNACNPLSPVFSTQVGKLLPL